MNPETDTKTLVERLRSIHFPAIGKVMPALIVGMQETGRVAADRIEALQNKLESLAETDYLHQAMEAQKRVAELEGEVESNEEQFREICLLIGFDPSEGEGTTPAEVVASVKGELDYLQKKWGDAESENAALKQEVATLKQDKNRIDWLEKGHAIVSLASGETRSKTMFCANFHEQNWREYETVREAIDAEIQVENNT